MSPSTVELKCPCGTGEDADGVEGAEEVACDGAGRETEVQE